jgi:hypothetical protein
MPYEDGRRNTVNPRDLNGICPTCREHISGSVDGVIKHTRDKHPELVPRVAITRKARKA